MTTSYAEGYYRNKHHVFVICKNNQCHGRGDPCAVLCGQQSLAVRHFCGPETRTTTTRNKTFMTGQNTCGLRLASVAYSYNCSQDAINIDSCEGQCQNTERRHVTTCTKISHLSQSLFRDSARRLCSETVHEVFVSRQCTKSLFRDNARSLYSETVHEVFVPRQCTKSLFRDSARRLCSETVHEVFVPRQCTKALFRDSARSLCSEAVHEGFVPRQCTKSFMILQCLLTKLYYNSCFFEINR